MPLGAGTRLGPYEIVSPLGAGGMGEVYRARDSRLQRDVAIKVLSERFGSDRERLARFEREAQLLAALSHVHIAAIFGFEEYGGVRALVMELVEGPTLAERVAAGPLPLGDALGLARMIAEAFEYAHERGIVHRDLKPANVKVGLDGGVKVLDFGLAKGLDSPVARGSSAANITHSPTLSFAGTMAGVILGTAAYMAPEQARGGATDRRADVWAFGCVLYEMLTGRQAFSGGTVSDTLAAVLRAEPEWTLLPAGTPRSIRTLLRRCLEKDPKRRLHDIADARIEIEDALSMPPDEPLATRASAAQPRGWRRALPFAIAVLAGAAVAGAMLWMIGRRAASGPASLQRLTVSIPSDARLSAGGGAGMALSPDGRMLVYVASQQLYRRALDSYLVEPVRGTENARAPFFSPDGNWIAFQADGKLKKIPVSGGVPSTICPMMSDGRGTWAEGDTVIFSAANRLYRVPAAGGTPEPVKGSEAAAGELVSAPKALPGGRAVVFQAGLHVDVLSLVTADRRTLIDGSLPVFASPGYLFFEREATLWAAPFDVRSTAVVGPAVPVVEQLRIRSAFAMANFYDVSRDGTLAYVPGAASMLSTVMAIDRQGHATPLLDARGDYSQPRLSPDGRRLAVVQLASSGTVDIWVYDVEHGTRLRLTSSASHRRPVWTPDGKRIAFQSDASGNQDIFWKAADGSGEVQPLLTQPGADFPDSFSPDGRALVFNYGTGTSRDLAVLPLGGKPALLLSSRFNERNGMISPDGRWLAYVSNESGRDDVYVQPYPGSGAKIPVSPNGGTQLLWSRDGRELFYREGDWLMSAAVQSQPFTIATPARLFSFERGLYGDDPNVTEYDAFADGKRFVAIRNDQSAPDEIRVVLNFSDELKRLVRTHQ